MGALLQVTAFLKDCIKQQEFLFLTSEVHTKFCFVPRGSARRSVCRAAGLGLRAGATTGPTV